MRRIVFFSLASIAFAAVESARSPLSISGTTISHQSGDGQIHVPRSFGVTAGYQLTTNGGSGDAYWAPAGGAASDSARVAGLSDSAKALVRYARTTAVHDTADSVRAYVRARIEDSLAGYLPLSAGASSPLTGELYASQGVRVGSHGILRDMGGWGALFGGGAEPSSTNWIVSWRPDGSEAYFGASSVAGFAIADEDRIVADSAGVRLYGSIRTPLATGVVRSTDGVLSSSELTAAEIPALPYLPSGTSSTSSTTPIVTLNTSAGYPGAALKANATGAGGTAIWGTATSSLGAGVQGDAGVAGSFGVAGTAVAGGTAVSGYANAGGVAGKFTGPVQITGQTTLATSLSGVLKADAGVVGVASAPDFPTLNQNTTGSAATLTTSRGISMTGDGSWSVSFNGGSNVSGVLTLSASGVTAGAYGSASVVPVPTVDAKGRITGMSTATITPSAIGAAPAHAVTANTLLKSNGSGGFAASTATDDGTTFATTGRLGWSGGILRDHYADANYFALYGSTVGSYGNNYTVTGSKNGQISWLGGSVSSGLAVAGLPKLTAYSGYIQPSVPLYMPDLNIWGTARSSDGGRWMHYMGGGTGGISNGTNTAMIQRYQYVGFSGFVNSNTEFYGITHDHQYGGPGTQLSIVAGFSTGRISFFVGTPTLQESGNYQAPRVGDWTNAGLSVTGTLSATSLAGTGTRMVTANASGALGAAKSALLWEDGGRTRTETSGGWYSILSASLGARTIPANTWQVGAVLECTIEGVKEANGASTLLEFFVGPSATYTTPYYMPITSTIDAGVNRFRTTIRLKCLTTGTSGTFRGSYESMYGLGTVFPYVGASSSGYLDVINTTVDRVIDFAAQAPFAVTGIYSTCRMIAP